MPQLTIDIDRDGNVEIEAHGFVGKGCEAVTKAYEEVLGRVVSGEKKPEYTRSVGQAEGVRAASG